MPNLARVALPKTPHQMVQRSHNKQILLTTSAITKKYKKATNTVRFHSRDSYKKNYLKDSDQSR